MLRALVVVALLAVSSAAGAQITTYIAPPKPIMTPQMVAAADSARKDSVAVVATTNMKAWVDSAAGVTVPDRVGDSTIVDPGTPEVTTTFSNGTIAPNTASTLPSLALFGVVAGLAGAALLLRRKPAVAAPAKPRD
jgi:LPXTG-motif cell wall-anchored protein